MSQTDLDNFKLYVQKSDLPALLDKISTQILLQT